MMVIIREDQMLNEHPVFMYQIFFYVFYMHHLKTQETDAITGPILQMGRMRHQEVETAHPMFQS